MGASGSSLWLGAITVKHGTGHATFTLDGYSCGLSVLSAAACLRATGQC